MTFAVDRELRSIEPPGRPTVRLTAAQFVIFDTLNEANGAWVPRDTLLEKLADRRQSRGGMSVDDEQQILRVQIHFLRGRVLGFAKIEGKHHVGYRLISSP